MRVYSRQNEWFYSANFLSKYFDAIAPSVAIARCDATWASYSLRLMLEEVQRK